MLKKILIILVVFISGFIISFDNTFSASAPTINCVGLPGCIDNDIKEPSPSNASKDVGSKLITNITSQLIQFVAVIAVLALIISGIIFMVGGGDEEKVKKAKTWIIWSLVGVFLSITALGIIQMLNKLTIG